MKGKKPIHDDRILALVKAAGPSGANVLELRQAMGLGLEHDRCIIGHSLTRLYRMGLITRRSVTQNRAQAFRYFFQDIMTTKECIISILTNQPGLLSEEIGKQLRDAMGRHVYHTTYLSEMTKSGILRREQVNRGMPGRETYRYWLNAPSEVGNVTTTQAPAPKPQAAIVGTVFSVSSDGSVTFQHQNTKFTLSAAMTQRLRNMLNSAHA